MKSLAILLTFIIVAFSANSQIQFLRYNDNFSYLKSDSIRRTILQKIKYIPISENVNVSFGGEIREQLQYHRNINFGDVPPLYPKSSTWQLWHRLMVHANIEVGTKSRLFTQLGSTCRFINPNPLTPEIEQNKLNLHQAFIDYHFSKKWMTRIGRQEMSYGSHRLITFREGPNTRLTFNAAVLKYNNRNRAVDVFAISPVISHKGVFDDHSFKDLAIGIYANETLVKTLSIDFYFLHFHSKRRQYNFISATENREVIGFRLFSKSPKTNYEVEANYQFGKFNHLLINAYGISADIHHQILPSYNMILGISGNYLTGDKSKTDNQLNTYNLLYSKPQYGLTAPIGATNIMSINPYVKLSPVKKASIYAGTHFMWRQTKADGIYTPGAIQIRPMQNMNTNADARHIGALFIVETNYVMNNHLSFAVDVSRFFAGNYVKLTGQGRDISYVSFKSTFRL